MRRNRVLFLGASVVLAALGLLVRAERAVGQKQEQLFIRVTERFNGKMTRKEGQADLHVSFTATARDTGEPGTQPWSMSTTTQDYQCAVQGGGKLTSVQDGTEVTTTVTYKSKDTPHTVVSLAQMGQGTYEIETGMTGNCAADMDVQVSGNNAMAKAIVGDMAALMLNPAVFALGTSDLSYDPSLKAGSPEGLQFYQQRSGTFDPNSKSFTRSGHASGSSSYKVPDGSATVTVTVDLDYTIGFNEEPEEVEAVITPVGNYDQWLPKAGHDEDTPGNGLAFNVALQKKGQPGKSPNKKAKFFKFELSDVSHEPGVCLNWPPKDRAKASPDLKIDKVANPDLKVADDGQSATSGEGLLESSVTVFSYDWGGYGKLKVTATLDDGSTVVAHLKDHPDIEAVAIPHDDNGNRIADAWENDLSKLGWTGSTAADADDDDQPKGDGHQGDGLSLYEEYRGFVVQGNHVRTDPGTKDLFVHDQDNLGFGDFGQSGLVVHPVKSEEYAHAPNARMLWPKPGVINFNTSGFAHVVDEHVVLLTDGPAEELYGPLGITIGGPGVPKNISAVVVDLKAAEASSWGDLEVLNTIAHELAHACNVKHHGETNYQTGHVYQQGSDGNWNVTAAQGPGVVAAPQGQNSGDEFCIMRYYRAQYYQYVKGNFRWKGEDENGPWIYGNSYYPTDKPGATFCTSPAGTGVNGSGHQPVPKAGDADTSEPQAPRGNCTGQFCVNDLKH